jgi:hypothetical protein
MKYQVNYLYRSLGQTNKFLIRFSPRLCLIRSYKAVSLLLRVTFFVKLLNVKRKVK